MRDHPHPQLLECFMRGEASALERRSIVRHLLTGCLQCLEITRPLWRFGELRLIPLGGGDLEQAQDEEERGEDKEDGEDRTPAAEARGAGSRLTR